MAKENVGFRVYIDESGCEGFKFAPDNSHGWSSHWFVISAVIVRTENELAQVAVIDELREAYGKGRDFNIHFRELKHEQKALAAELVGRKAFRTISVAVHKPSIAAPETFNERYRLYFYATRYLLERVSWLCRDTRNNPQHKAEVIFSNRAGMSYDELKRYITRLEQQHANGGDIRIAWDVIDCELIRAEQHRKLKGLQVADIVASAVFSSLHHNRFRLTETSYLQRLRAITYKHKRVVAGYGFKVWPESAVNNPDVKTAVQILTP